MALRLLAAPTRKFDKIGVYFGVAILLLVVQLPAGLADDEGLQPAASSYAIDNFFVWEQTDLEVLIVPPAHGPLVAPGPQPLPDGVDGALPTGTYLEATLAAIENWRYAIDLHAQNSEDSSWFSQIKIRERVLTVDAVTPQDVAQADILVVYPEHGGIVYGAAANMGALSSQGPTCVAANTLWATTVSMNRYDMFKLAGHEFGHCLGLGHTVGNTPSHDVMSQGGYPNDFYRCPSNLDLAGLVESFSPAVGNGNGGGQARVPVDSYEQYCHPDLV